MKNRNCEDEIIKSTKLSNILDMYKVENLSKHKARLNKDDNLLKTLEDIEFNFNKFWNDNLKLEDIEVKGKKDILV